MTPATAAEDYAPADEPEMDSLSPSSLNPVHRLLGLLVLKPALEKLVPDTLLVTEGNRDDALLTEVVTHIRRHPEVTTAALLGFGSAHRRGIFSMRWQAARRLKMTPGLKRLARHLSKNSAGTRRSTPPESSSKR
ncbi:MAG: hypothetical protein CM15mP74_16790 [Halieaceae bacterium]|nr:MAG: hypothetical protein CM15mP74_16790 [Halieaceae bacterium]